MLSQADSIPMTDTFAHGPDTPTGAFAGPSQPSGASQSESDVTGTLAELERKLHELERELTSIGRRQVAPTPTQPTPAQTTPPQRPTPPPASAQRPTPPSASAQLATPQPASAQLPVSSFAEVPFARGSEPSGRLVDEAADESDSVFVVEAERETRTSDAWLASLAELRMFRDRLERFAHELTDEYDALLARVMSSSSASGQRTAAATTAGRAVSAGLGQPGTAPPEPPPVPETYHEDRVLFEGRIELGAGPFYDIESLGVFERLLASVPHATDVAVRRFEASHAVVDVRLEAPVALVGELRRVLETDFSVRQITAGRLALTFDDV